MLLYLEETLKHGPMMFLINQNCIMIETVQTQQLNQRLMNNVSRLIINDPNTHGQSSTKRTFAFLSNRKCRHVPRHDNTVDVSRLENNQLGVNHSLANHRRSFSPSLPIEKTDDGIVDTFVNIQRHAPSYQQRTSNHSVLTSTMSRLASARLTSAL